MPEILMVAAPGVILRIISLLCLHRVEVNIAHHSCQIPISIDKDGLIAAPKQRAIPPMGSIKSLRVHSINMTHDSLEVSLGCLKGQVVVGVHETVGECPDILSSPRIFK